MPGSPSWEPTVIEPEWLGVRNPHQVICARRAPIHHLPQQRGPG